MELIYNNSTFLFREADLTHHGIHTLIDKKFGLSQSEYYLTQNGKRFPSGQCLEHLPGIPVRLHERLVAGKGGFGSMLRAIGAQIEKTTNREACRDLSGRRLRDINEEKRLKAYLDKQKDAPEDEAAKLQKKIDKLLSKPKHEFHDEQYNRARSDLTQNVDEAVQEGLKRAMEAERASGDGVAKRKAKDEGKNKSAKKKQAKGALWLGADDLGSSSSDSEEDSDSGTSDSACSSGGASSSVASSTKQTITSVEEDDKSNHNRMVEENEEKAVSSG